MLGLGKARRLRCGAVGCVLVRHGEAVMVRHGRVAFVGLGLGVAWLGG